MTSHQFAGWVPNILGRLSFSRTGTASNNHRALSGNQTADLGVLFAFERRASRDGPVTPTLLSTLFPGRSAYVNLVVLLSPQKGLLPFPRPGSGTLPELREDDRAELIGDIILFTDASHGLAQHVNAIRGHIRKMQGRPRSRTLAADDADDARALSGALWGFLERSFDADPVTSASFGRAKIVLSRTGECRVIVDQAELYTTLSTRRAQRNARQKITSTGGTPTDWTGSANFLARHAFLFVRDLAHRHYHHEPDSDMATTVFPWSAASDDVWRRETHYGLVRMAISARRKDKISSFKQSMGVIAYAESFQRHLAGWIRTPEDTNAHARSDHFPYDFAALRQSVDASIREQEFRRTESRELAVFLVIVALTALGLLIAGAQVFGVDRSSADAPSPQNWFWAILYDFTRSPNSFVLTIAVFLSIAALVVLRVDARLRPLVGTVTRAARGLMAGIFGTGRTLRTSQLLAFIIFAAAATLLGWLAAYAWQQGLGRILVPNGY